LSKVEDGKTWCWARTYATGSSPAGWRTDNPYILFQVTEGDRNVRFQFDLVASWQASGGFTGNVSGRTNVSIPIMVEDRWLKSLESCTAGMCVSNRGLQGLTKGSALTISGRTSDGRPANVAYSLRGYTAAINAMNSLCNNATHTGWLIK
jgi:hypothetical protein